MNILNIPGLSGWKTALAGWGLFLTGLGGFLTSVGQCLTGTLDFQNCYEQVSLSWDSLTVAFLGLGILGIGHKLVKARDGSSQ